MTFRPRSRSHWLAAAAAALSIAFAAPTHAGAYEDFFKAVSLDDAAAVERLLQRGFDANSVDEAGQGALFLAMREGAFKVAATLLKSPGLKVDQANSAGETALMMAALRGHGEWLPQLVAQDAAALRRDRPGARHRRLAAGTRRARRQPFPERHHAADDGRALRQRGVGGPAAAPWRRPQVEEPAGDHGRRLCALGRPRTAGQAPGRSRGPLKIQGGPHFADFGHLAPPRRAPHHFKRVGPTSRLGACGANGMNPWSFEPQPTTSPLASTAKAW